MRRGSRRPVWKFGVVPHRVPAVRDKIHCQYFDSQWGGATETTKISAITIQEQPDWMLTVKSFLQLVDVPAAFVWPGNIDNPDPRRAYQGDLEAFVSFCWIETPRVFG